MPKLKVATCQFPVSRDIRRNAGYIKQLIVSASRKGADIVHFSETALSGYAGTEFQSWKGFDWNTLKAETREICQLAGEKKIWILLGSSHPLSGKHLPHNCLYVIDHRGRIADRYDKRFLTEGDLKHYTPGNRPGTFTLKGVKCGLAICFEVRFPELTRDYAKSNVQCLFFSFYNARAIGRTIHSDIMQANLQCRAATNGFWLSGNNSSARYQSWPSIFVTPDGRIIQSLKPHQTGCMLNTVDTRRKFYDPSRAFRKAAMHGARHNGRLVNDPRSRTRTAL